MTRPLTCCRCKCELANTGAIIHGPPNHIGHCKRRFLCQRCYDRMIRWLFLAPEKTNGAPEVTP